MSRVEMADGLDQYVAERYVAPRVDQALDMLTDAARTNAPPVRVWVTMRDGRVRRSHVDTDGQAIPANLRFRVAGLDGVGVDMARYPRDVALPAGNREGCRCQDVQVPHLLRQSIRRTPVTISGTRVSGSVETRFPRAAESEFGTSQDQASHFMTRALQSVALRLQSGQSR